MNFKKFVLDEKQFVIDENSQANILIYEISYKTLIGPKPLLIIFDKNKWIYQNIWWNQIFKIVWL